MSFINAIVCASTFQATEIHCCHVYALRLGAAFSAVLHTNTTLVWRKQSVATFIDV